MDTEQRAQFSESTEDALIAKEVAAVDRTTATSARVAAHDAGCTRLSQASLGETVQAPEPEPMDPKLLELKAEVMHQVVDGDFDQDSATSDMLPAHWSWSRKQLAKALASSYSDPAMSLVILANVVVVVRETDLGNVCGDNSDDDFSCGEAYYSVSLFNNIFLAIYFLELVVRVYVLRMIWWFEGWNLFDAFVVFTGVAGEVFAGTIPKVSLLRVLRLARLAKLVRLFVAYRELYLIMRGFISTARTIFWASFLLLLMLTVCSIIAVEFLHPVNKELDFGACIWCGSAFETVFRSNVTLFQIAIIGDGWGTFAQPLIAASPIAGIILVFLVLVFVLGFSNLIMSVIVEKAVEARQEDERYQLVLQEREADTIKKKFLKLCRQLDDDGDGTLSYEELLHNYDTNRKFKSVLKSMKINREDLRSVFEMLDSDASGSVSYDEFAENLYKMKSADTTTLLMFIRFNLHAVESHVKKLRQEIRDNVQTSNHTLKEFSSSIFNSLDTLGTDRTASAPSSPSNPAKRLSNSVTQSDGPGSPLQVRIVHGAKVDAPKRMSGLGFQPEPTDLSMATSDGEASQPLIALDLGSIEERFLELRTRIQMQLSAVTKETIQKVELQSTALTHSAKALTVLNTTLPLLVPGWATSSIPGTLPGTALASGSVTAVASSRHSRIPVLRSSGPGVAICGC